MHSPSAESHRPALTPAEVALLQQTWNQVLPIADTAAQLFYGRLFELDPSLRPLFAQTDMAEQRKKLMQTLTVAVKSLEHLESLIPALHAMGKRHVGYGVATAHYATVGAALLWTLEKGLGAAYTSEVHDAWAHAYAVLTAVMLEGSEAQAA